MIGTIKSVRRYPVKSMRGEATGKIFTGYSGLIGDRVYAIHSDRRQTRFPWFTARNYTDLIRYKARFRDIAGTLGPVNPDAAHPNLPSDAAFAVDVETPEDIVAPLDDLFISTLPHAEGETLTLHYLPRNFVDVTPVSLVSEQTVKQLEDETGQSLGNERFRANFNVEWTRQSGFFEDSLIGKRLRIGGNVEIAITERDARCKMITLDPFTGAAMPDLLKHVVNIHGGCTGVYASVVREGFVSPGDPIEILE